MKYFILGSCVTRDIFRFISTDYHVSDYYARTSLRSIVSEPLIYKENDVKLTSSFQKRTVIKDLEKTFFYDIQNTDFDYLLIDLIDERFELLQVGNSIVTRSTEFINSGLDSSLNGTGIVKVIDDWKKDCYIFANRLLSIVPSEKIIIHEAYWAKQYFEDGVLKDYRNQEKIDANNNILKEYYNELYQFTSAKMVRIENRFGDSKHMWGLAPFHYTKEYYKEVYKLIIEKKYGTAK
ncbi:hypothetical protein KDN24_14745 [Bacillus sp. Bva_UNVM-123]|uniref:DUF6270 domain-containing protein n=1 Tax=Bacillus sp. Bva_UNVM-123 TaxID=2829798 RepID=UPI00391FB163